MTTFTRLNTLAAQRYWDRRPLETRKWILGEERNSRRWMYGAVALVPLIAIFIFLAMQYPQVSGWFPTGAAAAMVYSFWKSHDCATTARKERQITIKDYVRNLLFNLPPNSGTGFRSGVRLQDESLTTQVGFLSGCDGGHVWVDVARDGKFITMTEHPGPWWTTAMELAERARGEYDRQKAQEEADQYSEVRAILQNAGEI